jgi:hypothetical protein
VARNKKDLLAHLGEMHGYKPPRSTNPAFRVSRGYAEMIHDLQHDPEYVASDRLGMDTYMETAHGHPGRDPMRWNLPAEPDPGDAMSWSPAAGEHEIGAWGDIFHDRRRGA